MKSIFYGNFRRIDRPFHRRYLAVAAVALLINTVQADEPVVKAPHFGPYRQEIASVGTWRVQPGYVALDRADTSRLMERFQNPGIVNSWLYAPDGLNRWFSIITYADTGHVNDDEKIESTAILAQLKQSADADNAQRRQKGWPELHVIGWQVEPHYESDTKRLSWATRLESNHNETVNYTTKVLSRTGVATITLVTSPEHLDSSIAELKAQLNNFTFHPDQQYAAFRSGDKIAEYGLTGLIVGGAAAAAVKTGAWKWLVGLLVASWKIVAASVLALLAAIKSLFKRSSA